MARWYVARRAAAYAALGVLVTVGCTAEPGREASPDTPATSPPETTPSATASGEPPEPRTADDPLPVEPTTDPLGWEPVPGPVDDLATRAGAWTIRVPRGGAAARLDGPRPAQFAPPPHFRITAAFLDEQRAVVVAQDRLEERPQVATVLDLATGRRRTVDGRARPPTTTGGTWGYHDGVLAYATVGPDRAYCLARLDLARASGSVDWCAPARSGFSNVRLGPDGDTLMSFDDGRPQCRTLLDLDPSLEAGARPLPGPPDCTGWEAVRLRGSTVWTTVEDPNRIELARAYAELDGGFFDLGPADSGSLTTCAAAAYFTRPQDANTRAALVRWTRDGALSVVYQAPGRPGFLTAPRCGGQTVTVTAYSEAGDEQVSARTE